MTRKILFLLAIICNITALAGNISRSAALQTARQFMSAKGLTIAQAALPAYSAPLNTSASQSAPSYYVFNADGGEGYVIVSGDDRTIPVLAYSTVGSFRADDMPDNMKAWLQYYADCMAALDADDAANDDAGDDDGAEPQPELRAAAVPPLITTTWDQATPYWNLCPTYNNVNCYTGCVATAMAQVMYHHRHPAAVTATIPSYTTKNLKLSVDSIPAGATIDWDLMLADYRDTYTDSQATAVAQLMKYCGVSVSMDYGTYAQGGSGTYCVDIVKALKTYFDYDSRLYQATRSNYTIAEWQALLLTELEHGRPIIYMGQSTGGGHCFVIDGYEGEETGYFHVNWGWSGASDGYYAISVLNPYTTSGAGASSSADGYSYSHNAVVGVQRNGAEDEVGPNPNVVRLSFENFSLNGETLTFGMWNNTEYTSVFHVGYLCEDSYGNLQEMEIEKYKTIVLSPGYGWSNVEMNMSDITDMLNLTKGEYKLYIYGEKYRVNISKENIRAYVKISIDASGEKSYELHPIQKLTVEKMVMPTAPQVNVNQRVVAIVRNDGEEYNGMFYVYAAPVDATSKKLIMKTGAAIPAGDRAEIEMFVTPTEDKNHAITLTIDKNGNNVIGQGILKLEPDPIIEPDEKGTGDVDDNGRIDISDVVALTRYIIIKNSKYINKDNADVNEDGRINVTDVIEIVRRIVNN
ncbi:MAG: C10 family peptidase [Prevotella sp.]